MAIAFDATANGSATSTTVTYEHTCTGDGLWLAVTAFTDAANNDDTITGITYNAVAMTQEDTFLSPGLGGHVMFSLSRPAPGAHDIVVTSSASTTIYSSSTSYTGVLKDGQPEAESGSADDPATTKTESVTILTNGAWLVSSAGRKQASGVTISASTGVESRNVNTATAIGDSNGPLSPGSKGQKWDISGSSGISVISLAIAPTPEENKDYFYFM